MLPLVPRREVTVDSVQPLYGPIAGGTRVTISGQSLSVSTVTAVHIGQYILKPDTSRLQFSLNFTQATILIAINATLTILLIFVSSMFSILLSVFVREPIELQISRLYFQLSRSISGLHHLWCCLPLLGYIQLPASRLLSGLVIRSYCQSRPFSS